MRPRSEGEIFDQGPESTAARAAFTARLTPSLSPSATRGRTSPVAGLYVGNVLPDAASTHLPVIRIFCVFETKLETLRPSNPPDAVAAIFCSPFPLFAARMHFDT